MAISDILDITNTPVDIVAGESLAEGDYTVQNVGGELIYIVELESDVADVSTLVPHFVLACARSGIAGEKLGLTVTASNRFYIWSLQSSKLGIVAAS